MDLRVRLVPLEGMEARFLHPLAANVLEVIGGPVMVEPVPLAKKRPGDWVVALGAAFPDDRWVVGVGFLSRGPLIAFGGGRVAVVRADRLIDSDGRRWLSRLMKAVNHAIGRLVGLEACPSDCVMGPVDTVQALDARSRFFCDGCRKALEASLRAPGSPPG